MLKSDILTFHSLDEEDFSGVGTTTNLLLRAGMKLGNVFRDNVDIIVFNGGADIGTSIYGEKPIDQYIPEYPSLRDRKEIGIYEEFCGSDTLLVGICRGAQLLNCLNGGSLWQDVNNHTRDHMMTILETGETMVCTSTHHQMMRPGKDATIIATADEATVKIADGVAWNIVTQPKSNPDIEIVWYPLTGTLCIQGHPEYVPGSRFADYCLDLIRKHLKGLRYEAA